MRPAAGVLRHPPAQDAQAHETTCPSFSLADCDPITGDHTSVAVTWNGSPDLGPLRGQPIYLRFQLRNRGLCAFRIADSAT